MAVLWLIQFATFTLNILWGILFVLANKDFCGSIFETRVGEWILQKKEKNDNNNNNNKVKTDSYTLFV